MVHMNFFEDQPSTKSLGRDPEPRQLSSHTQRSLRTFQDLPLDILHCIFDHLNPAGGVALAISSKALHTCLFRRALVRLRDPSTTRLQIQAVHLLLEKQCADRSFYCPACDEFHDFCAQWHDTQEDLDIDALHSGAYSRATYARFEPNLCYKRPNEYYMVTYPLARLVMIRHLLGQSYGLPLSCFEAKDVDMGQHSKIYTWTQTWRAKIINNKLFLSAVHTISQIHIGDVFRQKFSEGFRKSSGPIAAYLCKHTAVGRNFIFPCMAKTGSSIAARDLFVPCQDEPAACNLCLSDFTTTTTWHDDVNESDEEGEHNQGSGLWSIVFTTYHRLGTCRTPTDWKFSSAAIEWEPLDEDMRAETSEYCAASIRRRWKES